MKKIISLTLVVLMLGSLMPLNVNARKNLNHSKNEQTKNVDRDSKKLEQEILKNVEKNERIKKDLKKQLLSDIKIVNAKKQSSNYELRKSEPVGKTKFVSVHLYVPFYSDIDDEHFYSDKYYSGWLPLTNYRELYISGELYWSLIYSGYVQYKDGK